jgi:L-histidine Nalpha-methyltransferase / hercynylcysteine S-oxide synthase
LRKTSHILLGLAETVGEPSQTPPITYFALDLEERELLRTLGEISKSDIGKKLEGKVTTKGMWGSYDEGLKYIQDGGLQDSGAAAERLTRASAISQKFDSRDDSPSSVTSGSDSSSAARISPSEGSSPPSTPGESSSPLHLLFLGSSLGNFDHKGQVEFLRSFPLRPGFGDTLLIGIDHDNEKGLIEAAYNDKAGVTKGFIMNGLRAAGRTLGDEKMFDEENWEYVNVRYFMRFP